MRRTDREVNDSARIQEILNRCTHCRLGLYDGEEVYIVPMNFGWEETDGGCTLWFHCAGAGRKLDILRQNPKAGFQMDTDFQLRPAENPCDFSAGFASIVGTGTVEFVSEPEEKRKGLAAIMNHTAGVRREWAFPDPSVNRVTVLKMGVEKISCKATGG